MLVLNLKASLSWCLIRFYTVSPWTERSSRVALDVVLVSFPREMSALIALAATQKLIGRLIPAADRKEGQTDKLRGKRRR